MVTTGIASTSLASSLATGAGGSRAEKLGKQEFLKLLVAQLAHQNPLDPMDNTEFIAQLAQFSSLEQLMSVNRNIGLLQLSQASMTNSQVAGLIGREVEAKGATLTLGATGGAPLRFTLDGAAKTVTVRITDASGRLVRTLELGPRAAGLQHATWDGKDATGLRQPAGTYTIAITARDARGRAVRASTTVRGVVSGVRYERGIPYLELRGMPGRVRVGDVVAVRDTRTTKTSGGGR